VKIMSHYISLFNIEIHYASTSIAGVFTSILLSRYRFQTTPVRDKQCNGSGNAFNRAQTDALVETVDVFGIRPIHQARRIGVKRKNTAVEVAWGREALQWHFEGLLVRLG